MQSIYPLIAFQTISQTSFAGMRLLVPLYAVQLQAPVFVVGMLVALMTIGPTLASVPVGRLIDRVGTRTPLILCLLIIAAACTLPALWPALPTLYFAAPAVGSAYYALYLASSTMVSGYGTYGDRAGNFSRFTVGGSVAQGLGPLAAGVCVDQAGFAAAFLLMAALVPVSAGVATLGRMRHLDPRPPGVPVAKSSATDLLRHTDLANVYVLSTMFIFAVAVLVVMLPIHGAEQKLSASQMGTIMACFSVAALVVRAFGGLLSRHYTSWQLMLIALSLTAISSVLFGMTSAALLLMLLAFTMGLGQGIGAPMSTTALYEVAPPERASEAMGLRLSLGMAAQTVVPLIAGGAGTFVPAGWIFISAGMLIFAGVFMQRRQWRRRRTVGD